MKFTRSTRHSAFTLIELLVVIAIIGIIAGLVVGLNNVATEKKKISRAQVERDRLVTLIEAYKLKIGVYPPANTNDPGKNTLVYELAGAIRNTSAPSSFANPRYETAFGNITADVLFNEFGIRGIINAFTPSVDDATEVKRFLKNLKPDQYTVTGPNNVLRLVIPVENPSGNRTNFWNYLVGADNDTKKRMKNPESFDLWVDIKTRAQTRTIGNWKE